ncbi:hypothetical protein B0T10DRAFT_143909 [Thelonectria olida]|uniref:Pathogen-related protein n=1 Tax=Thelonectria olida TaxID=1576542 RepID=A0A9P8VV10_9HYPO|nr:hypothetical protein B0T10DRAFT_143909 [Thelonectria olida]
MGSNEAPAFPDYFLSPDAVLEDDATWRFGRKPDYTKNREAWRDTKVMNHKAGSLQELVENVVKNWEIEASYKPNPEEWRTINHKKYQFRLNGGPPQPAEAMAKIGTYNALIEPNKYYSPEHMDFSTSHKTFKRMMPTFAWEVLEVYSGPPKVAFKWRHWGTFQNDYSAKNDRGEKVTLKSTGKVIDVKGMTVAELDEDLRIVDLDIYFDPMDMFRQMDEGTGEGGGSSEVAAAAQAACPFMSQSS